MDNALKLLLTDQDRNALISLKTALLRRESDLKGYRDTLANVLRRSHDINAVMQKLYRKTELEMRDCDEILKTIGLITTPK